MKCTFDYHSNLNFIKMLGLGCSKTCEKIVNSSYFEPKATMFDVAEWPLDYNHLIETPNLAKQLSYLLAYNKARL